MADLYEEGCTITQECAPVCCSMVMELLSVKTLVTVRDLGPDAQ